MIKHILSIIWNQRRSNGWIFAELLVVAGVFWLMVDMFYVDTRTYYSPRRFCARSQNVPIMPKKTFTSMKAIKENLLLISRPLPSR
jgi:hypothetical protein